MNRKTMLSVATMGLLLAACACHRVGADGPSNKAKGVQSVTTHLQAPGQYDVTAGRQIVNLRWNRTGDWSPIRFDSRDPRLSMALVARDRAGDRLLSVHSQTGYEIDLVTVDCEHRGIVYKDSRTAPNDDAPVNPAVPRVKGKRPRPTPVPVSPVEIARLCAKAPTVASGTPRQALMRLREAGEKAHAKATVPQPPLDPAERERMWREYQARSAAHK